MCDIVVSYISLVLSFLAERSNEDGVVLRGNEGNGIEVDERRHGHSSGDDQIGITVKPNTSNCNRGETRIGRGPYYYNCLRRLVGEKANRKSSRNARGEVRNSFYALE